MVGLGGGSVELMGRVAFGVPPLRSADIDRMIEDSGIDAFLRGNSSRDKLREVLVSLSRLIEAGLEIDQLEINPLLILEDGRNAVAVDAVIRLSPSEAGHLQQQ